IDANALSRTKKLSKAFSCFNYTTNLWHGKPLDVPNGEFILDALKLGGASKERSNMSGKTIAVLATLDTKGHEAQYLREQIEALGDHALLIDTGVTGVPAAVADVTREQVAEAGGIPLVKWLDHPDREIAAPVMADGA